MEGGERDVVPGHFELQLPINTIRNIDKDVVIAKLTELRHDLKSRIGRPEELAILHMQGVLSFRIREYEDALGYFQSVLDKDPDNLNALANQHVVTDALSRMTEAQRFKDKLEGLLACGGDASSEDSTGRRRLLKARCLAEHAYAHSCDIHIDRVGEIIYQQANYLYVDAIKIAGNLVDASENDNWQFCRAKNAHKIFDFLSYKSEFTDAAEALKLAERLFFEITQSPTADREFQWESWRHLADMIRATKKRRELKNHHFLPELKAKEDPEMCMAKAAELAPENPKLWARYANYVFSLKRKECFKRAMEYLKQSFDLDSSENNYYAYSTRAKICLKHYKYHLAESEKDSSWYPPSVKHLETAKQDCETSLEIRKTPWGYSYLGEIHHLLAKHQKYTAQGQEVIRGHIEKSQVYFRSAEDCQDGHSRPTLYLVKGTCLFEIGEYDAAIRSFLRAIELEPKSSQFSGHFTALLQVYLHKIQLTHNTRLDELLEEIASQLEKAKDKFGNNILEKHTISRLKSKYSREIKLMADYCQNNDHIELVPLLKSVVQHPPYSYDLCTGGILEEIWMAAHLQQAESQQDEQPPNQGVPVMLSVTTHGQSTNNDNTPPPMHPPSPLPP